MKDDTVTDDQLISLTMRHLDLEEIKLLFQLFSREKIKPCAGKRIPLHAQPFFAWYYFKAKRPDAYLKTLETRRLNRLATCL